MQTILGLVAAGLGVALVPQCMSKLQRPDVRYLALDARGFEVETVALWQTENRAPALAALIAELPAARQGCPSSAWRKRSLRCAPSCGGMTKSSFSTITLTRRKTGPFLVRAVLHELGHLARLAHRADIGDAAALGDHRQVGAGARLGRAVVARAGVRGLIAGLAELLVVEHEDREIVGLLRRHGGERAQAHQQVGVARDHQHALGRAAPGRAPAPC